MATKLASGFVELTARLKKEDIEITPKIDKSGIDKDVKDIADDFAKGMDKAAKKSGESIRKESAAAGTKGGQAAADAFEAKIRQSRIDQAIEDKAKQGAQKGAKEGAEEVEKAMGGFAAKAGDLFGTGMARVVKGFATGELTDQLKTLEGAFNNVDTAASNFGINLGGVTGPLRNVTGAAGEMASKFNDASQWIGGANDVLGTFAAAAPAFAGKIGILTTALSKLAGPLAAIMAVKQLADTTTEHSFIDPATLPKVQEKRQQQTQNAIAPPPPGQAPAPTDIATMAALGDLARGGDAEARAALQQRADAGDKSAQNILKDLPKRAGGGVAGVDRNGKLFGPGDGISDSILGVDLDGVPTALVSRGEGVVKHSAMRNGGDKIVAALNAGMQLPGYDDGTTNVGGPAVPVPPIKVPEASGGQAGAFNDWLSQQQGKAYQYGTLYDCSGFMSQIYNRMTGKDMPRFNTESDLSAYGFVRGTKPGTFQLGIHHGGGGPNSHMAGTLPDGRNVESGGSGVQIGAGASGAFDKQFEDHWFLPGSESMGGASAMSMPGGGAALPPMPAGGGAAAVPVAALPGGADRTQGYIPAGAGASGQAGTSMASGLLGMGAQAINGLIDQAASMAATAASAAATMGSFGAGGQAGGAAASFAIGLGTEAAKRGVDYGFQMAGIGVDSLAEIFMPFGVPRLFSTDATQFMPQLPGQAAATTTGEKAEATQGGTVGPDMSPAGPVQPGQLPGMQPVAAPMPRQAEPGGITPEPVSIGGPAGGPTPPPAVPTPAPAAAPAAPAAPAVPGLSGMLPQPQPKAQPHPMGGATSLFDIAHAYGLAKGGVVGVYDKGGWLPPGGVAINKSRKPEPVLTGDQFGALRALAAQPALVPDSSASGASYDHRMIFNEGSIVVRDVEEMSRELDSRKRIEAMRYSSRP